MALARRLATIRELTTEVLVIGGGVAALRAAVAAREAGAEVLLCCKSIAGRSGNTVVSTADVSAYVPELGTDDSDAIFAEDTIESGASIADERLVRILAEQSGPAVLDLERLGIPLLRANGEIDRTRAAGHSRARTYRADAPNLGPNKGLALSVPLADRARTLGVRILDRSPMVHLVVAEGRAAGAVAVDLSSDTVLAIAAGAVVLAAGGACRLFTRTNSTADATGDGIALALRAGAAARDMEFIQWHPTRMDEPVPLFVTNGLLADGAVFRDKDGREFMPDYDPRGNLAPRDVLAKAVYLEAARGRGVDGGVYLDCSGVPDDRIALRHAYLAETLQKHGVDFPSQWLVVSPATHFLMGGITIGEQGESSLPGLFAVGESAGGIHGANRLSGNAFCEGLVFGTIAGRAATASAGSSALRCVPDDALDSVTAVLDPRAADPQPVMAVHWLRLRETMWSRVSLVRDAESLARAAREIAELASQAAALRGRSPREVARLLELRAALDCAKTIVAAATFREESRGAHWRTDFPEKSAAWFGHTSIDWPAEAKDLKLTFHPKAPSPAGGALGGRTS